MKIYKIDDYLFLKREIVSEEKVIPIGEECKIMYENKNSFDIMCLDSKQAFRCLKTKISENYEKR